jgi:hypothetical protein
MPTYHYDDTNNDQLWTWIDETDDSSNRLDFSPSYSSG